MPQLTAEQIAGVFFRDENRVIPTDQKLDGLSLKSALDELEGLGFSEEVLDGYRRAFKVLPTSEGLHEIMIPYAMQIGTIAIHYPENIDLSEDFFLGAQHDGRDIGKSSDVAKLMRFDLERTLSNPKFEKWRGPRIDRNKLAL